jgi:predicted glycosyltransferase
VLVTVGGGEDGIERLHCYLDAIELGKTPWRSTLIAGPLMPRREVRRLRQRAEGLKRVRVRRFHGDLPGLLRKSDALVCMAGYNMSAEALQSGRPVVFLPRTFPRAEQLVRAQRLERLGLCRFLVGPTARDLRGAVEGALAAGPASSEARIDLDGSRRFCEVAESLLRERRVDFAADVSRMAAS